MNYVNISDHKIDYYVKVFNSPRSRVLPEALSAEVIDLIGTHHTLLGIFKNGNLIKVWRKLRNVRSCYVWIEYSGNPFANIIISLILIFKGNSIALDCHNSAVEYTKGKLLRYIISIFYIKASKFILNAEIVVHNNAIKKKLKGAEVFYTPFPRLPKVYKRIDKNDILFLCSLNADEPITMISHLCQELTEIGYKAKVTGDPKKITSSRLVEFMFDPFLSYEDYLTELYNSRLSVSFTERADTLLFAPREAVVLGVRCLVNDSTINREFYQDRVFYTTMCYQNVLKNIIKLL